MITITKQGNGVVIAFDDNQSYYIPNGKITLPLNSLILSVSDTSEMVTFKLSSNNDYLFTAQLGELSIGGTTATRANIESLFASNMTGSSGGGGGTGAVDSVNGQTGTVNLTAADIPNAVAYDAQGNIVLPDGSKLLGSEDDGTTHELIGLGEYNNIKQVEVGSVSEHLNLNTLDNVTVDTPDGKKTLVFTEDLPVVPTKDYLIFDTDGERDAFSAVNGQMATVNRSVIGKPYNINDIGYNSTTIQFNKLNITNAIGVFTNSLTFVFQTQSGGYVYVYINYIYDNNIFTLDNISVTDYSMGGATTDIYSNNNWNENSYIATTNIRMTSSDIADQKLLYDLEIKQVTYVYNGTAWIDISEYIDIDLSTKQDKLVSGQNIKTINGQSILGSDDLTLSWYGTQEDYDALGVYNNETLYYIL